jgi:hypothetical protein
MVQVVHFIVFGPIHNYHICEVQHHTILNNPFDYELSFIAFRFFLLVQLFYLFFLKLFFAFIISVFVPFFIILILVISVKLGCQTLHLSCIIILFCSPCVLFSMCLHLVSINMPYCYIMWHEMF